MASLQELQRIDRELFSELTESPINPAFLHMSISIGSMIELTYDLKCRQTTRNESWSDAWRAFLCYISG